MKILLVQNLVYVPSHGGANKSNRALLEGLAESGHACRAVALATGAQGSDTRARFLAELAARDIRVRSSSPGIDVFEHHGVEVHAASGTSRLLPQVAGQMRDFAPAVVLVSHAGSAQPLLEAVAETVPRRPFVYLAHSTVWLPFGPGSFRQSPVETALLRRADGVIAVSNFVKGYLERWGGIGSVVLPFPVYGSGPFPYLGCFDRGCVTLVNPSPVKGLPIFLELAKRLPDVSFAAVPTYRTTQADRRALEALPNVRLLEAADDIDRIFSQTRILVVPSLLDEAFGVIVVEAMLRGIPVLASDTGGLPEAKLGTDYLIPVRRVERYEERFDERHEPLAVIPEQDAAPWVDALRELLADRRRYERLSRDSREAALAYVAGLGWQPFEGYLANLSESRRDVAAEAPAGPGRRDGLPPGLAGLSPERQELLALRLRERIVRTATTETPDRDPPPALVALEAGGTQRPFFCVHPAAGTVDCYLGLARQLGPDQPFYALQAAGLNGERQPIHQVGEMAAHYLEAVRRRQRSGPYLLGGWSFGAVVAFEMAQQLQRAGEEVDLLALFDSLAPVPENKRIDCDFSREIEEVALIGILAAELAVDPEAELVLTRLRALGLMPARAGLAELYRSLAVYKAHQHAAQTYTPEIYPKKITLLRTAAVPIRSKRYGNPTVGEQAWGWSRLSSQPVEVHVVPGNHYSLLVEPHLPVLAARLRECLRSNHEPVG